MKFVLCARSAEYNHFARASNSCSDSRRDFTCFALAFPSKVYCPNHEFSVAAFYRRCLRTRHLFHTQFRSSENAYENTPTVAPRQWLLQHVTVGSFSEFWRLICVSRNQGRFSHPFNFSTRDYSGFQLHFHCLILRSIGNHSRSSLCVSRQGFQWNAA